MAASKIIKNGYQTRHNAHELDPVLKKLNWAQQPNVDNKHGKSVSGKYTQTRRHHVLLILKLTFILQRKLYPQSQ